MSEMPIHQHGRQEGLSRQGLSQNPPSVPSPYQNRPVGITQAGPTSQQYLDSVQQRIALIHAAAKMAEDAASAAGEAADMARHAAEMVSQATNLCGDGPSSTRTITPFRSDTIGEMAPAHLPITTERPLYQQHIDQPIENYQSQFPAASESGTRRKRKARASSRQEAGGGDARGSIDPQATPGITSIRVPGPGVMAGYGLADFELRLKMIEEANKRRGEQREADGRLLRESRGEHESAGGGA